MSIASTTGDGDPVVAEKVVDERDPAPPWIRRAQTIYDEPSIYDEPTQMPVSAPLCGPILEPL